MCEKKPCEPKNRGGHPDLVRARLPKILDVLERWERPEPKNEKNPVLTVTKKFLSGRPAAPRFPGRLPRGPGPGGSQRAPRR